MEIFVIILSLLSTCLPAAYPLHYYNQAARLALVQEPSKQQTCASREVKMFKDKIAEISNDLDALAKKVQKLDEQKICACQRATSCSDILKSNPQAPSGYYNLQKSDCSMVQAYCHMTLDCKGVVGGWRQVAKLDMTNVGEQCPPGTKLRVDLLPKRVCGIGFNNAGCSSTIFDTQGIEYEQVCGKIIAYQDASTDGFGAVSYYEQRSNSIDDNYVDGISLTHGSNPRKHIWTFAAALDEVGTYTKYNCPCTNTNQATEATQPPDFIENDYFCDTASSGRYELKFYPNDPLWDGAGCGPTDTCCSLNSPPWFRKELPSSTNDNIEMRMCRDHPPPTDPAVYTVDEDVPIESLEIYVR